MNKKIIHIVLGKANPNRMNGVNRVVHFLSNALCEIGNDVEVWGLSKDKELDNTVERTYTLKVFVNGSKSLESTELKTALEEAKNTVFHLHGGFIPVFSTISKIIKSTGNEFVFTPHGCYTEGAMAKNKWRKKLFFWMYDRYILLNAKTVQGLGYQESADMRVLVPSATITDVANGQEEICIDEIKIKEEKTLDLVFGYCGRLDRNHKGLDLLIDGYIDFKSKSTNTTKLWIIGGGDYESEMKRKISEAGLDSEVVFFGPKFGQEKFNLIAKMDVFFHTSRHEGLPTAVLEACYLGVPSAVTPQTSFDKYLEDYNAGWRVEELSSDAVTKCMNQIMKDYSLGELEVKAQNAKSMIRASFSWIQIAHEVEKMYQ